MTSVRIAWIVALLGTAGLTACGEAPDHAMLRRIAGADPEQGRTLIHVHGCGTCHTIEGVRGARGKVGPALVDYSQQHLLAGFLPNTPPYLIAWLMDPVSLNPRTAMPAQGVTETEARHIASYLYTLGARPNVYPSDPQLPLRDQEGTTVRIEDPIASRTDTTPRTHRIVPPSR